MAPRYAMLTNYHYLILGHRLSYGPAKYLGDDYVKLRVNWRLTKVVRWRVAGAAGSAEDSIGLPGRSKTATMR